MSRSRSQKKIKGRVVVGIHACKEALSVRPKSVNEVFLKSNYVGHPDLEEIFELCKSKNINLSLRNDAFLSNLASTHQGVGLEVSEDPEWEPSNNGKSLIIALDQVEDPHNLGAILRTAWLMGAEALLVTEMRSAALTPTACKVACGGAEHVPVEVCGNLRQELESLKKQEYWVYGLAGESAENLYQQEFGEKTILVVGSEAKGLRKPVREICDQLIALPQTNAQASYNASVAAAIAISEVRRQQG